MRSTISRITVGVGVGGAVMVLALAACGGASASGANTNSPTATPASSRSTVLTFPPEAPIDPALGVSTAPVTPLVPFVTGTFEGFPTYSYIPPHPVGIVYLFHGSTGSANFANKTETVDVLNELIRRRYGFVSTESTNRTAKQWDVDDASMTSNPDLLRMNRLRQHIIATTPVGPNTPLDGIGMSNGSAFCALWAAALSRAGTSVSAVGLYMAGPTRTVQQLGGLRVPTFMVVATNDTRTNPVKEKADLARIARYGEPTELQEVQPRRVVATRYLRIPGVTSTMANAIVRAYQAAGLIDAQGDLIVSPASLGNLDTQKATARAVRLPAGLTASQKQAVGNETNDMIAAHQFNAEFKVQNAKFFDANR